MIATFCPSTNPASLRPRRNAAVWTAASSGERLLRNPTTGMADCCPRATAGHAAAAPPRAAMKSRRLMVVSCDRSDIVAAKWPAGKGSTASWGPKTRKIRPAWVEISPSSAIQPITLRHCGERQRPAVLLAWCHGPFPAHRHASEATNSRFADNGGGLGDLLGWADDP